MRVRIICANSDMYLVFLDRVNIHSDIIFGNSNNIRNIRRQTNRNLISFILIDKRIINVQNYKFV